MRASKGVVVAVAAVLLVAAFLLSAFFAQPQGARVKVGAVYQETGSGADWGARAEQGVMLAVEKINRDGGVRGVPLQVIFEDSRSNPGDAVTAMNKLVSVDNVSAVLSQASSTVVALSPVANRNGVVLIDTGATTPAYLSPDDYTFRVSYSAPYFAKRVSELLNERGVKSLGVLFVNDDYGKAMLGAYAASFRGAVVSESFASDATDFRVQLQKLASVEALALVSNTRQTGLILRQKKELGFGQPVFTDVYSAEYQSVLDAAGGAAEGMVYAAPDFDVNRTDSAFTEFNAAFESKFGGVPNALSAQAFDGVMVLAAAMRACENPADSKCVKEKLYALKDFEGVVGLIAFDRNGDVVYRPTVLKTVRNNSFVSYLPGA